MVELIFGTPKRLERVTVFTPLGVRFWDPVRDTQVGNGLKVTAWPEATSGPVTTAFCTASGVYAFQGLPGLQDLEYPSGDLVLETSPPSTKRFVVKVDDRQRRFLPTVFSVDLPYKGIFPVTAQGSPPGSSPPGFYLFSAPTRPVSPGLAVMRGDLVEPVTGRPAAHAVLEVQASGQKWYGVADERGCVVVLFPYPTFISTLGTSPPDGIPVSQQRWELTIRVRYAPTVLTYPPGAEIPDLRSIFAQPLGLIYPTQAGSPVTQWSLDLIFGQELVMRTDDLSTLWVSPNTSPP